jgi:hypothetical protein
VGDLASWGGVGSLPFGRRAFIAVRRTPSRGTFETSWRTSAVVKTVDSDPNQLLITDGQTFVEMDGSAESPQARWPREMPPLLLLISFGRVLNKLRLEARATLAA